MRNSYLLLAESGLSLARRVGGCVRHSGPRLLAYRVSPQDNDVNAEVWFLLGVVDAYVVLWAVFGFGGRSCL